MTAFRCILAAIFAAFLTFGILRKDQGIMIVCAGAVTFFSLLAVTNS